MAFGIYIEGKEKLLMEFKQNSVKFRPLFYKNNSSCIANKE